MRRCSFRIASICRNNYRKRCFFSDSWHWETSLSEYEVSSLDIMQRDC